MSIRSWERESPCLTMVLVEGDLPPGKPLSFCLGAWGGILKCERGFSWLLVQVSHEGRKLLMVGVSWLNIWVRVIMCNATPALKTSNLAQCVHMHIGIGC